MIKKGSLFLALFLTIGLAGCSSVPEESEEYAGTNQGVYDPLEGMNRSFWNLNYNYLDPYFVKPVSLAYVNYTPKPVRSGIANFLSNLDEPSNVVNNLLMGNGDKAIDHFNRFWLNSTVGLLGLIDVASAVGIENHGAKDFGDAVGHYGVGNGPYVMVPGYGPFTVRETADYVDGLYAPLTYLNFWGSLGKWAFEGMESRAALASQDAQLENSPDPYALVRDAYIQYQQHKAEVEIEDVFNEAEEDLLDEYLDDEYLDEEF